MTGLLVRLARVSPVSAGPDPELDRALALLDRSPDSETLRTAALVLALAGACGALATAAVSTLVATAAVSPLLAAVPLLLGGLGAGLLVCGPRLAATAVRVRALGDGPDLVCRAVLRASLEPTPERTAAFAATGDGTLARSLAGHVRHARGAPTTAWSGFRAAWRDHDPSLARAVSLVEAATNAPDGERERLLDRALSVSLDAVADRVTGYASDLESLVSGVYAFGVVLPLALVGLLPVAPVAGVAVSLGALAVVYDLLLPAALAAAIVVVLAHRPAAFPPAAVPADHPALDGREYPTLAWGAAGALGAFVAFVLVAPWAVPLAPVAGAGLALVRWTRPALAVRDRVCALERGLPDALVLVGQHVRRGTPPEHALAAAGSALEGPVADVFADAARIQQRLNADPKAAFVGRHGALADLPSPRTRAVVGVLDDAVAAGRPGGRVLVTLADHVDRLVRVERDATAELASVTNALATTGRWVAPVVAGVTVALARRLRPLGDGTAPYPPDALALVVAGYVLALAVLLPAFAVAVERGVDRARVLHAVGGSLAAASVAYPVTVALASLVTSV